MTASPGPRALVVVCALLAASAALLWAGAAARPAASGVAVLALAGVAAVVATGGVARRVVGGVLGLAGAVAAVSALAVDPIGAAAAAAGGVLLLVAGGVVLVGEPRLARLGARYGATRGGRRDRDPDLAAWQDLDAGRDPTVDVAGSGGDDPRDGPRGGAV